MSWLMRLMLKEEFRVHTSYTGRGMFLSFPFLVALFSLGIATTSPRLLALMPLSDAVLVIHLTVFLYGLSVGAFGYLGRQYLERRNGTRNYIVTMPTLLPMELRSTFVGMYVRDAVFYVALLLAPATAGLALSIPLTHFRPLSIAILFGTALLSFLVGVSLSFFVSTLYLRNRAAFGAAVSLVFLMFVLAGIARTIPVAWALPGFAAHVHLPPFPTDLAAAGGWFFLGSAAVGLLVAGAVAIVPDRYEPPAMVAQGNLPRLDRLFHRLSRHGILLAKEVVDLRRSGTVTKMIFSFVAPLIFLSFTAWFVRYGLQIPVGFNSVFYGAMVGFFGVTLYNWLTNVDTLDYMALLPLSVPQAIRTKLAAFLLLTTWITLAFVVGIALLNADTGLLWLAIPVSATTSVYMVTMTAYLTGLRTDSFLFDPGVLARFSMMAILPDLGLTILSFSVDRAPVLAAAGIGAVLATLAATTYILLRGIESKWQGSGFDA